MQMHSYSSGPASGPSPEDIERMRRRVQLMRARERIVPVCWPVTMLLARSGDHAIALRALWLYPDSVQFGIRLLARRHESRLHMAAGMPQLAHEQARGEYLFRFGVRLADGRSAANLEDGVDPMAAALPDVSDQLRLSPGRGSGGDSYRFDLSFELNAVPPDGPLTLVVAWPVVDIGETQVELDATGMGVAAAEAIDPWPGEVPEEPTGRRAPRLEFGERSPGRFFRPVLGLAEPEGG